TRTAASAAAIGYIAGGPVGIPLGLGLGLFASAELPAPTTPVFDLDGDPGTFNPHEQDVITEVCQRVAETYSPFDINITTVDPGSVASSRAGKICIGGNASWVQGGDSSLLGISLIGSFHNSILQNVAFVFASNVGDNS